MDNRAIEGEWIINEADNKWTSHKCTACGKPAIYEENIMDDYDEDIDGEWRCIGTITTGITEYLTPYCPFCGAKLKNDVEEQANA